MNGLTTACIDKNTIRELIPHSGSMCLLDSVLAWDEQSILCASHTHLERTNPLRRHDHLSAIHAFEYGAQAVAIHGGLRARAAGTFAPPGYFAALRHGQLTAKTLDRFDSPLEVRANHLFSDSANCVYECHVAANDEVIARGRVTIIPRDRRSSDSRDDLALPEKPVSRSSAPVFAISRRITAKHPSLPGHFPGQPIVPGVVILDEVAAALAQWRPGRINHIHLAKFLSPLKPEQVFTIGFASPSGVTRVAFHCWIENRPMVEGFLEVIDHD